MKTSWKQKTRNCIDCFYWKSMGKSEDKCCNYIFVEDKIRPCHPGDECTVKITKKAICKQKWQKR